MFLSKNQISVLLSFFLSSIVLVGSPAYAVGSTVEPQPVWGEPLQELTVEQRELFNQGKRLFEKDFFGHPALGPIFNQSSCAVCHGAPGTGGRQIGFTQTVTRFGKDLGSSGFDPLTHLGGSLLQKNSILGCSIETIPSVANVQTVRIPPHLFGNGLIESIPDFAILANVNKPITGGVAHMVPLLEDPNAALRVGRFGWKAQLATGLSFSGDASNMELGISNRLVPNEQQPNAPEGAGPCSDGIPGIDDKLGGPELSSPNFDKRSFIDLIAGFQRYLAPAPQTPKSGMRGEQVFKKIGCANCHVPKFMTAKNKNEPVLSQKPVKAYSDFLLHYMGTLGDGIAQGNAKKNQMKTPHLSDLKNRIALLHDGRVAATNPITNGVELAIAAHDSPGSDAVKAARNYLRLSQSQKDDLMRFLASLGRREFDSDSDNNLTAVDLTDIISCFKQPSQNYDPEHACAVSDLDQDRDVDDSDFDAFEKVFEAPITDCQCDNKRDSTQIRDGLSLDANKDAIADECMATMNFTVPSIVIVNSSNQFTAYLSLWGLAPGEKVEFFFGTDGQGNGGSYGAVYCINVKNSVSMGTANADSHGRINVFKTGTVPSGKSRIYFQAAKFNQSQKSSVKKVKLDYQ